jgi:hypothetical protein
MTAAEQARMQSLEARVLELELALHCREADQATHHRRRERDHHEQWRRAYYGDRAGEPNLDVRDLVAIDRAVRRYRGADWPHLGPITTGRKKRS